MNMQETDRRYMRRALQLARNGMGFASPNPMVGAVIVSRDGMIIGEGWHRRCGEGHAEVNAVASVKPCHRALLRDSCMYVTLEPCSHYGKTPPCAKLIIETGIPHVVVGTSDPFEKVSGRGVAMLREAGVRVDVGVLEAECRALNRRFFTAHELRRPYVTLKWACSADGYMDHRRDDTHRQAFRFSNALTALSTMRLRSLHDAVLTTSATVLADDCRLNVRDWDGKSPRAVVLDRRGVLGRHHAVFSAAAEPPLVFAGESGDLENVLRRLYSDHGITSVLVEAGATLLGRMVEAGLWDRAREEQNPVMLGESGCGKAPRLSPSMLRSEEKWEGNTIRWYENNA